MATVVNLPPDPSFGSGRAGAALGRFITSVVEGRRKKQLDEERSAIIQRAFDDAALETDPTLKAGVFTQGISKTPGIKPAGIKSLTDTFIELGKARKQADQAEALAGVFGGSGGDITESGKVGKPVKEAGQPKIDKETARALGDQFLPMLKLLSDNRKAASTAKLNESKIQRAIDQTKNDLKTLENKRDRTAVAQEQLKLSKTDSGRKERRFGLDKQKHALDQRIEGRKQELADLNAAKAEQVKARNDRELEIKEAKSLIDTAKEKRAQTLFDMTPKEKQEIIEGEASAKFRGQSKERAKLMREVLVGSGIIAKHAATSPGNAEGAVLGGVVASDDAQLVAQMIETAGNLSIVGLNLEARIMLERAAIIAKTSPSMIERNEMNAIISREMAARLNVPIGTPLRDVADRKLLSPVEMKKRLAIAGAEGLAFVRGKEDIGYIDEATVQLNNLLLQVEKEPGGLLGLIGKLKRTGKTALGIIRELGLTDLLSNARDLAFSGTQLKPEGIRALFSNPTLSVLDLIEHSVGLTMARLNTPVGRVPVEVIKIFIRDMKLTGLLITEEMTIDRMHYMLNLLASRRRNIVKRTGLPPLVQEKAPTEWRFDYSGPVPKLVPMLTLP